MDKIEISHQSLSLSFYNLKCKLLSLSCCGFINVVNKDFITFVELTDELNPVVMLSVAIDQLFKVRPTTTSFV